MVSQIKTCRKAFSLTVAEVTSWCQDATAGRSSQTARSPPFLLSSLWLLATQSCIVWDTSSCFKLFVSLTFHFKFVGIFLNSFPVLWRSSMFSCLSNSGVISNGSLCCFIFISHGNKGSLITYLNSLKLRSTEVKYDCRIFISFVGSV